MMRPLRVALIAPYRFPVREPFAGGLEAHVWHLSRALAGLGHRVTLFAAPGSDPGAGARTLAVRHWEASDGGKADPSVPSLAFLAEHHAYLALMLHLADTDEFDVIHDHSMHYLPVAMTPALRAPILTTLHTPPIAWLESAVALASDKAGRFAAVSQHIADVWRGVVGPLPVVPNGIDAARWPLGPGGEGLVWFGRLIPDKAPHLAIAAALRAGWPLRLAGPVGDQEYYAEAIRPQLCEQIQYVGHLGQGDLAALVGSAAAALATPAWDEPYGLVVAEAMCTGTPVVAFARGGVPELISAVSGRLVPPGDVEAMSAAVAEAARLPRAQVREHCVRRCSLDSTLDAYLGLYRSMTEERTGAAHDRLLHPPSRPRASDPRAQHLLPDAPAGRRPDVVGGP